MRKEKGRAGFSVARKSTTYSLQISHQLFMKPSLSLKNAFRTDAWKKQEDAAYIYSPLQNDDQYDVVRAEVACELHSYCWENCECARQSALFCLLFILSVNTESIDSYSYYLTWQILLRILTLECSSVAWLVFLSKEPELGHREGEYLK